MRRLTDDRWTCLALLLLSAFLSMGVSSCSGVQIRTGDDNVDRVLGMIQSATGAVKGVLPIGYEEERLIGLRMAQSLAERYGGLLDDPAIAAYVNLVGSAVALESKRPDIPYFFGVLNSDSVNAFACPGGYIFITKGALVRMRSEAELAGVLGHEIAHVANKHVLNSIRRSNVVKGAAQVTVQSLNSNLAMMAGMMDVGIDTLVNKGLSKSEEDEADREGTVFASHLGYHPSGLSRFIVKLGELKKRAGGDQSPISVFFSTHPESSDRLKSIQESIAALKPPAGREGRWLEDRFQARARGRI